MDKVKVGLIGAGGIAQQHLKVIRDIDWIKPIGISSRTRSKAEQLAKEYEIPYCEDSLDGLIEKSKPDALLVLVSEEEMYNVTAKAIPSRLPLFIEKPPGLTPDETRQLVQLAKKYKTKTMVGFNRRYYSIFHKGLEIIRKYGQLLGVFVEGHERMWRVRASSISENVMREWIFANSTHTIDLLRFFGGEPKNLKSIAHSYVEPRGDQFAAIMELESGAIGQYSAHWYSPGGWRVVLYGEAVTVDFKPLEKGFWIDTNFDTHEIIPDEIDTKYKTGFYRQMEAFGRLVRDGEFVWPMLDLEGAYKTMKLAEKLSLNV
ncbi:MAG: Gfo/Idh/MocA family oxidoreductase [Candidatus Omnitrophica bacterium]|nr:Gfo/Idh/MocA family oxidoreductase [Candidatus Omnitrophota bacterium]